MKRFFYLIFLILSYACDDGDLQIETIDFDSATIQNCDPIAAGEVNVLFKLNTTEALIVELPSGAINNEITTDPITYNVAASGPVKITYRTFSDNVSTAYFCSSIPVTEPTVSEEIVAEKGELTISTILNADGVTYEHEISLKEISFVTSTNVRITNLAIDDFGTVTTTKTEEAAETEG